MVQIDVLHCFVTIETLFTAAPKCDVALWYRYVYIYIGDGNYYYYHYLYYYYFMEMCISKNFYILNKEQRYLYLSKSGHNCFEQRCFACLWQSEITINLAGKCLNVF